MENKKEFINSQKKPPCSQGGFSCLKGGKYGEAI